MEPQIQPELFIKMVITEWDKQNNNFIKFKVEKDFFTNLKQQNNIYIKLKIAS